MIPNFRDYLNESANLDKNINFENVNGKLNINIDFQESEGYDTMKAVNTSDAEVKLSFENSQNGLRYYYNDEGDYEDDRDKMLDDLLKLCDSFDERISEIMVKYNFSK